MNNQHESKFKLYFLKNMLEIYENDFKNKVNSQNFNFEIKFLDDFLLGLKNEQMYILGARPGLGKTTFVLNIISNILKMNKLKDNEFILFISLEMGIINLYNKLIAINSNIPLKNLSQNNLNENQNQTFAKAICYFKDKNLIILEANKLNIFDIQNLIDELKKQNIVLKNIFIDYIQLLDLTGSEPRNEKLGKVSKQLRVISKQNNLNMFILSQLTRDYDKRLGLKPNLSDLKDSGNLEQDADVVLFLWESEKYLKKDNEDELGNIINKKIKLSILKNRNENIYDGTIDFELSTGKMK